MKASARSGLEIKLRRGTGQYAKGLLKRKKKNSSGYHRMEGNARGEVKER